MKSLFKKYFVSGALILVPIAVTGWVLKTLILWCEGFFTTLVPTSWQPISIFGREIPGVGLLFVILLILLTGVLTRLYLGRKLIQKGEQLIQKIPFGRSIYSSIKQLLSAVVSPGQTSFRQVVLVEYPRKGSYMIGFVTGESAEILQRSLNQKLINIFIPTTPNPTSGFLVLAPRENITPVDISTEQAFKLILSGGTVSS